MSVCLEVRFPSSHMPDADWLAASVASMVPGFAFAERFDFTTETGWCPCLIKREACGFEWELEFTNTADHAPAGSRFDAVARLEYRSSPLDAICATVVAANLANITGGVVCTPEGQRIEADAVLVWASDLLRDLPTASRTRSPRKRQPNLTPEQRVQAWLAALVGAEVDAFVRSLPDDPTISVRYGTVLRLQATRWVVGTNDGSPATSSTETFPRSATAAYVRQLEEGIRRLVAVLQSGPVLEAVYDPTTQAIRIVHPAGVMTLAATAGFTASADDSFWSHTDSWALMRDRLRIRVDEDTGGLQVGAY